MTSPFLGTPNVAPGRYPEVPWIDVRGYLPGTNTRAIGDGNTDDAAAIAAADTFALSVGAPLLFSPGTYRTNSNVVIASPCIFVKGATVKPNAATSITFNTHVAALASISISDISLGGTVVAGALLALGSPFTLSSNVVANVNAAANQDLVTIAADGDVWVIFVKVTSQAAGGGIAIATRRTAGAAGAVDILSIGVSGGVFNNNGNVIRWNNNTAGAYNITATWMKLG